ncbi:carbohydrate ABC transporter permease [Vallitalea pronyensis]|uniref:Carbohydrate ABC transporter permease n=1 Tax=Vallitalea pronyensis TaxID=1348613 RepID=A0A8J8MPS8_9FIRM|nr:carbohydrate ABC transporter permease [Vallitalea pronyensis]QUI25158.1 carbohydrate ABC transporter permease [Vallitalea pronyensis]
MGKTKKIIIEILAVIVGIIYLSPVYIMVVNAFKNRAEMYESVLSLPSTISFEYFRTAMSKMSYLNAFMNSLFVTVISIGIIVVLSSMTAWMLVRTKHVISKVIFFTFIATMLIPFQAVMMPLMQVMGFVTNNTFLSMLNTRFGLIYMYVGFGSSMAVFLFHGFIKSIPTSLEEAATIDGCNKWKTFWKIIFPVLKPTTVTVIILDLIWIWNDFLLPSLVLSDKGLRTIPLSTFYFFGEFTIQWNLAMAGLVLTIIPVIIFYMLAQKHIIKGVTAGAIK